MEPDEFLDRLATLTVAKSVLSKGDVDDCFRYCEVIQAACREKARRVVRDNASRPLMFVYMCDGWSATVDARPVQRVDDEHLVIRNGRYKHEFLLERGMVRKRSRDQVDDFTMLFSYPRGVCKGRSAWNCFTAATEFHPSLRQMGATGITLEVSVVDGALFSAFTRHMEAKLHLYYDPELGADLGEYREHLSDREWPLKVKCRSHGCSNGVVWSLKPVSSKEKNKMAHNAIRSLRGSSEGFYSDIDLFLFATVAFRDTRDDPRDVRTYWEFLRVNQRWVDLFVWANPFYDGTFLVVDPRVQVDPDATEKLSGLVQYSLREVDWSETRWCKVNESSTCWLKSESVGVSVLVRRLQRNPDLVNSYIGGYASNLTAEVREYLAVAAFCSVPCEAVLLSILEDNRLLKKVPATKALLEFKIQYIWDLPDLVFRRCLGGVGHGHASHSHP